MAKHHPLADIQNLRRTFLTNYKPGFPILEELIQNAEDAGSSYFDYGWIEGISNAEHPLLRDPALFVLDNGRFTDDNAKSIQYFSGWSSKPNQKNSIGKFGLGLKSVFHLCEAFFYISHEIEDSKYNRSDIFNPWAGDKDWYHEGWDNFSSNDCEKVKEKLKLILSREEYKTNWFVLWIPLRQKYHCIEGEEDGIPLRCIKYSDDDFFGNSSPSFLHEDTTKQELALLLPLLHSLHTVRYWERSLEKEDFSISIDASERRWDLQHQDTLLEKTHYFNGNIAVNNEYKIIFSARELIVKDTNFNQIISRKDFPGDFKYIKPHIAVVLTQWISFPEQPSTLTIRNAVFLPIGDSSNSDIYGDCSHTYCLTLHGYFFVDSARIGILGWSPQKYTIDPQKIDGDNGDSLLKKEWNFTLYKNLLAEVIPELESLPEPDITSVCQALKKSKLFKNNEESICSKWQWVYQLDRKCSQWKIISSKDEKRILQIPRVPDLVWQIAPALGKLADDIYLIEHEDNCPNLIPRKCLDSWHDSDIIRLLEPSLDYAKILTNIDVINFLIDLVKLPSKTLSDRLQKIWKQVLRKAFQATGMPSEPMWDSVGKAIALLDKDNWFQLKFDDSQLLQDLSREKLDILVIPQDLAPSSKFNPEISGHDAGLLISHLIDYQKTNLQGSKQLIEQVVKAIPHSEIDIFRQSVNNLEFVPGFDCRSKCDRFYSPTEIEKLQKQGLLFKLSSKSQGFSTDLQIVLRTQTLVLVDGVIANKLLQQEVKDCDREACLRVLQQKPELSDVENRTNLLKRLLPL